jgi:hypothetical protein
MFFKEWCASVDRIHQSSGRIHWGGFVKIIRKGDNCFLISDVVFQVDIRRCFKGKCALHINIFIYPLMKVEFSSRTSDVIYQSKEPLDIKDSSSGHCNRKFRDY